MPLAGSPPLGTASGLCGEQRELVLGLRRAGDVSGRTGAEPAMVALSRAGPNSHLHALPQNRAQHQAVSGLCALLGKLSGVPCVCGQLRVAVCQASRSAPSLSPGLNDLCLPGADPWAQCGCRGTQPLPPGPALCIFQSQLDPMYHFLGLKGG